MSVVLWSLGAVVGLTILLAGFNWFQNNRMLQRELESVRSELKALIASQVSEAERPLAQRIDARLSEVESQLKKTVETTVTKATAPLIGKVDDIGNRLGNIEFASHKAEFDHWLTKGVPSNACSKAAQLIDKAVDLHNEYDISQSLNLLSTALDALEASRDRLDALWARDLENALNRVGSNFSSTKIALLQRLAKHQA